MVANFALRRRDSGAIKRNLRSINRRFISSNENFFISVFPFLMYFFSFSSFNEHYSANVLDLDNHFLLQEANIVQI